MGSARYIALLSVANSDSCEEGVSVFDNYEYFALNLWCSACI